MRADVLGYGSINLNGLATPGRLQAACAQWRAARYHIVFIQEHHLTSLLRDDAILQALAGLGWEAYISFGRPGPSGRPRGGTGILIRRSLLASGELSTPTVQRCPRGRFTALTTTWSGHRLHLCSVYLPNQRGARRAYIQSALAPLAAAARADSRCLVWAGDFNFTPAPHQDRSSLSHTPLRRSTAASDASSQAAFSLIPDLCDLWRNRNPILRAFTFTNGSVCARLDRVYVSTAILPFSASPTISPRSISDHCPISATLLGTLT